jgi:hypothetical protein
MPRFWQGAYQAGPLGRTALRLNNPSNATAATGQYVNLPQLEVSLARARPGLQLNLRMGHP